MATVDTHAHACSRQTRRDLRHRPRPGRLRRHTGWRIARTIPRAARDANPLAHEGLPVNAPETAGRFVLSPIEARVVATLMEKARTVPDSYPLTMNALLTGCNQKTSRDPLMNLDEGQVAAALDTLKSADLVRETSGGRTARFAHNFQRGFALYEQAAVLLAMLILRGPQTAGELRLNTERWYPFADISSVEGFLEELQDRPADKGGPMVVKLARTPGTREQRWAHLLSGPVDAAQLQTGPAARMHDAAESDRLDQLEQEVARLRRLVDTLCAELGVSPDAA